MFKPDKKLQRWYAKFNRSLFDGVLPADVQVGYNELEGMYATLAVSCWTSEEDGLEHRMLQIHVDPARHHGSEQLETTLIHEMAHIKVLPKRHHGKEWKEEMTRLFLRGAFWGRI